MNFAAIRHHAYDNFCYPLNEDELVLNIQTDKKITKVILYYGDPFRCILENGNWVWEIFKVELTDVKELQKTLIWTTTVKPEYKRCKYYFEIHQDHEIQLFFEDGFYTPEDFIKNPDITIPFCFPWMNSSDIANPPEWAKNTVWYQIFPSRFCHSEKGPEIPDMEAWPTSNTKVKNEQKFGGNLEGIIEKLDYLYDLGINGIYLNPVNHASSQHKYDTIDYLKIDPDFGDEKTMQRLVKEAHKKGMHIMLDGVFNHSGWFFWAWQDVLKNKQNSKYASWYMVNDWNFDPNPCDNAAKGKFYSFAFTDYMPKLNTNNPEVLEYILKVCEYWVREYDIDAIRLDVANELSHNLCIQMRYRLRNIKPDFFIVGEIWNNSLPWLRGDQFDSVINYPLRSAIYDFQFKKEQNVKFLEQQINQCLTMYYKQTEQVMINQMDSHDTIRLITQTKGNKDETLLQFGMILTLPGSACIYYGTEVLLEGGKDPDCRRCMPWKEIEEGKFDSELEFMKTMIHMRREHPALRSLDMSFVYEKDDLDGNNRIVHIRKICKETNEAISCYFNFSDREYDYHLGSGKLLFSRKASKETLQPGGFAVILH